MRNLLFTKMHGTGNDYIYINGFNFDIKDKNEAAKILSNRNYGIGSDGLVFIFPSDIADFRMEMYNSDGSESEMCGNATRCIAKYVYDNGLIKNKHISLETKSGVKQVSLHEGDKYTRVISVDMGEPIFQAERIPVNLTTDSVINYPINIDGIEWKITAVSMGNPHAVVFTDDINKLNLNNLGPKFEHNALFPNRINTEFIEIIDRNNINMRVWERGAGETLACGSGACAAVVAAILNRHCNGNVNVNLKGGVLNILWDEKTNHVFLKGEATSVFTGEIYYNY